MTYQDVSGKFPVMRTYVEELLNDRRFISGVNLLLGLLLSIALLYFIRDVLSYAVHPQKQAPAAGKAAPAQESRGLTDYAPVLKNNPFGFEAGELRPLNETSASSQAKSDVVLIGTVAGRPERSYAIFSDKAGKQEVFKVGESVFGLGRLKKVETAKVILDSNGRETDIPLADITAVKEVKVDSAQAAGFGRRTGDTSYQVDQQKVQQALEKPDQIMTDARFVPNVVDGKQQGFVLRELKAGGIYQSLGLRNGDVLLRINEFEISNPETALQAFTALRGTDRAQLDILRGGAKLTMTYQIR